MTARKKRADLPAIGARLRQIRGEMLQEELAACLGISQGQLSKIERGKLAPTAEILVRLVEQFDASSDWLLLGRQPERQQGGSAQQASPLQRRG